MIGTNTTAGAGVKSASRLRDWPWYYLAIIGADALIMVAALFGPNHPGRYMGEEGLITRLSITHLLAIGAIALALAFVRHAAPWRDSPGRSAIVWLFISAGFVFLALDERLELHEQMDFWLHDSLHLEETAVSDRLDDLIVVAYGVLGAAVLYAFAMSFNRFAVSRISWCRAPCASSWRPYSTSS